MNTSFLKAIVLFLSFSVFLSCSPEEEPETLEATQPVMTFWTNSNAIPIDVYLNNTHIGTITEKNSIDPECGINGNGSVTINVAQGSNYDFYAKGVESTKSWEGSVYMETYSNCKTYLIEAY